ncbi:PH domain-containing protein [Pseudidiomarina terrestris]|uniref:PH domain-containing protein n=1 Tax=Pseudidiomarina terrestris TaxID=2820060 RepID=A0AAW7QYT5_9GAMM|nr:MULTISPECIES: PH domain-containing protein [unclassified Pseudidiomarina]MDN7125317.1 PH domain-containing protein [Pseudidiomarina sp. 1APP75-32.1]MDN7127921.1 PH domain-containing protein [Pseudidiomarina sp. 1APR75-33.1]MDN7130076.1 PH domain-containing protein [Pseudidiomarina sp. 1APR75-15]MDN7135581.1 PH domain-containing protein [Pseudidiomarina sp. 1ASP75-5]MDN7137381.1 PH domain-containing protein [Pseudidiomarina sp. 1ASP75-14]
MSELTWQRTPLITIAFFLFKQLKQLVTNISNLIPAFAAIFVIGKDSVWVLFGLAGAYLLYVIISAVLTQRFFLYAIADDAVHLRTGIFNRKHLTLNYERIQQAEIHQVWYFRPFKLTVLSVDSAGSAGKEVQIPGLKMELAQDLRQRMLAESVSPSGQRQESAAADTKEDAARITKHFPVAEIIRAGIIDNKLFVLLAVLIYPISQLDLLEDYVVPWVQQHLAWFNSESAWIIGAGIAVGSLAVLFLAAIAVSLLTYHDLTLTIEGERFQAKSGALSIRTLSFRYPKLQAVYVRRNLRARLLQRSVVTVSQLQPRAAQGGNPAAQQFTLPVVDAAFFAEFREQLRLPPAAEVNWQRLSPLALLGSSLWLALLAPVIATLLFFAAESGWPGIAATLAGWILMQTMVVLSWRNYGYSFVSRTTTPAEQWFVVRRGIFSRNENWYPRRKVQQIDVQQGPWLRLLGFSHLILHTAAGSETLRYLPSENAQSLQQQWVDEIAKNSHRWM